MAATQRWLDAEERATWLALMSVVVRLPAELDRQLRRDAGLRLFEYHVLAALSEAPGRALRMTALAAVADGSLPRLSQVVAKLERRGLVERSADPVDGRYTLARLTDAGVEKIVASAPAHVDAVAGLVFDRLTRPQQAQLRRLCERIFDALDPEAVIRASAAGPQGPTGA